ncbi:hypothetical protein Tco_0690354, partial [Tanacetum coccineum]
QQQHAADVHPDELCPPNKRYDLMYANKKVDLKHVQCLPESKILTNIIKNHPLRFIIAASSSVPWIYMTQFWHTLKEYGSKYRLRFMLDKKELTLTMDDFRQIFHLPQATTNNHNSFLPPPSFSNMVPSTEQSIGYYNEFKDTIEFQDYWSSAAMANVMQNILQMLNNSCHWMGPTAVADNANAIIVSHYMTIFHEILRRVRDMYHNLQDDDSMKNIFNSGRYKNKVGMQIPAWMISDKMKHTEHYRMTTSTPRSPNPDKEVTKSSAPRRSTMIRLRLHERRSIRLTPPAPVPIVDKAYGMILQDTLQVSLAEHKSREEQEARENVALVDEHLASEEIKKMVDGQEHIVDDSLIPRNDESNIPGTRIEPRSDKESPEVEIAKEKEVEISKEKEVELTNVVIPVNVNDEDEEIIDEVYELKRREKGKIVEEIRNSPIPTPIRSPRIHTNLVSLDTEKLQELTDTPHITSSSSLPHKKLAKTNRLLSLFKTKPTRKEYYERAKAKEETERLIAKTILQEYGNIQAQIKTHIDNAIANVIPSQVDASYESYMFLDNSSCHPAQSQTSSMKFERNIVLQTACKTPTVRPTDQDDPHENAHLWGDSAKCGRRTSNDDEIPSEASITRNYEEYESLTIDEANAEKMAYEMLRQRLLQE